MWQLRALHAAAQPGRLGGARPRDKLGMCVISVLMHNYDDAVPVLLQLLSYRGLEQPSLCSAAKIARTGHVMADVFDMVGCKYTNQALFENTKAMEGEFRRFADRLHLTDPEREEFFAAVKRWVVCDFRIDPTMNPADPEAKRLVH